MLTLWDLLPKRLRPAPAGPALRHLARPRAGHVPAPGSMQDRYDQVAQKMLAHYKVRVRRWRSGSSGVAWAVEYRDGTVNRLIEAPRPKGPMSAAIFLHEIGHHAIGLGTYKPRCLEEYHAWMFALRAMEENGLNVTDAVRRRMHRSLKYSVDKARRRGLRELPGELVAFVHEPPRAT